MKTLSIATTLLATVFCCAAIPASALECSGINIPDATAAEFINNSGTLPYTHKISALKTLVIKDVEAISGVNCNLNATLGVTLQRKLRRDAHGTITMKGSMRFEAGKICITDPHVTDVSLSYTLEIGEAVYKLIANKVLPNSLCLNP